MVMSVTALSEKMPVGARRGEYRGAETVAAYRDPWSEFAEMVSGCAIYDLGWRAKIELTGKDRVRWLNSMVTNNVRDLAPGGGVYAFVLTPQGRILADLYVYNRGESLLIDTDQFQAAKLVEIFRRYIIMDKVELNNISDKLTAIGITGPKSREVLQRAGFELPQLGGLQLAEVIWQGINLRLVRREDGKRESYEVWLGPEKVEQLWSALVKAHATPVGSEVLELYRIANGIPAYGQDIHDRDLPQETGQMRALNFTKGCYIGQEIVERIRSRGNVHRAFTGFEIEGSLPAPGTKLELEGKEVGEITSAASLPLTDGERPVALGYIRREAAASGNVLFYGQARSAIVTELPFWKSLGMEIEKSPTSQREDSTNF
jgi:folate-binding protein YgfZ